MEGNSNNRKRWILRVYVLSGLLILMFFLFRQNILDLAIEKARKKVADRSGMVLNIQDAGFAGLFTVGFKNISVVKPGSDTLLTVDTLSAHPSVWHFLTGHLRINNLYCTNANLTLVMKNGSKNFSFAFHDRAKKNTANLTTNGYSGLLNEWSTRIFDFAPQQAELNNIKLIVVNDSLKRVVRLQKAYSTDKEIRAEFSEENGVNRWFCNGRFSQSKRTLDVSVHPEKTGQVMPLLSDFLGLKVCFNRLEVSVDQMKNSGGTFNVNGKMEADSLLIHHHRIADDDVVLPPLQVRYHFTAGRQSLTIDSISTVKLGQISFHPFFRFDRSSGKRISISLHTDKTNGSEFFNSLPTGMFDEVRSIEAEGSLQFGLDFSVDLSNPDSVLFETKMIKDHFRIKRAGELMKMNGEFIQQVFENGRYIRSFSVGPSNPDFTPFDQISIHFKNAVLTSEDGSFFYHNGFNEEAFRKSISANLKAKKFVRGGSTISMQLVKNVFLTRKKTIARKAEEALIVWLIESNRLYTKERMFEVYLNIIELGPDIYGIGEASRFYFNKKPADITLQEGVFLASLLPHPKWFKYSFDANGQLKPYLANYYRVVSNFMLRKNLITQEQHDALLPVIDLKGPAREKVVPTDTILPQLNFDEDQQN